MIWLGGIVVALAVIWLALVAALYLRRPASASPTEALRLLPDVVRLAREPQIPARTRSMLWLLLGYLVLPIDLVPDFLPGIGFADDAILTAIVLRHTARKAGPELLRTHWPGTDTGYDTLTALFHLPT